MNKWIFRNVREHVLSGIYMNAGRRGRSQRFRDQNQVQIQLSKRYFNIFFICVCLSGKRNHSGELRYVKTLLVALRAKAHIDTFVSLKRRQSLPSETQKDGHKNVTIRESGKNISRLHCSNFPNLSSLGFFLAKNYLFA